MFLPKKKKKKLITFFSQIYLLQSFNHSFNQLIKRKLPTNSIRAFSFHSFLGIMHFVHQVTERLKGFFFRATHVFFFFSIKSLVG